MGKKAVFGTHFYWDSYIHIGSHQYAKQFARNGYRVGYISEPISPLHYVFAKDRGTLKEKSRYWYSGGKQVENGKIWAYVPFTLLPIYNKTLLRSKYVIKYSHRFTLPSLKQMLKKNNLNCVDILFLDEAYGCLLDLVHHNKSVLRIHDDISFLFDKGLRHFLENEKEIVQKVDLVAVVSKLIKEQAKELGARKILYLPNGVEFEHFQLGSNELPEEYKSIPAPRVVYVGSISDWFDIDLIEYVGNKLPEVSFVLIGKPTIDTSRIACLSNVHILGPRSYNTLPQYLKNSDIGIMPFRLIDRIKSSHPNKLYQYMACNLPVVSIRWKELEDMRSPAYLASDYQEFAMLIEKALNEKNQNKYIEFAKANSWANRFKELLSTLYPSQM